MCSSRAFLAWLYSKACFPVRAMVENVEVAWFYVLNHHQRFAVKHVRACLVVHAGGR